MSKYYCTFAVETPFRTDNHRRTERPQETRPPMKYHSHTALWLSLSLLLLSTLWSCKQPRASVTPWGTVALDDSTTQPALNDIMTNGEIIMVTLSGSETCFDYHGRSLGLHYLMAERFAHHLGVRLRMDVCTDTAEMVRRVQMGEADVVAFPLTQVPKGLRAVAVRSSNTTHWAVANDNRVLADSLQRWFSPSLLASVQAEERRILSTGGVTRRVYSPFLDRSGGVISRWDDLFRRHAPLCRWDWRLLAAQCYQESTFDPNARSWAGAKGLMQIMPSTARHLGLSPDELYNPERNVEAATRYIRELDAQFQDVPHSERLFFVLASYNGGSHHIRDAMRLAESRGRNANSWGVVREYVLGLSSPTYYRDPVVRYGYMRGSETVNYVDRIRQRWADYRGGARPGTQSFITQPERAGRRYRWRL